MLKLSGAASIVAGRWGADKSSFTEPLSRSADNTHGSARTPRRLRLHSAALLPAATVLVALLALMPAAGGFFPRDWYPAGLALLAVAMTLIIGARPLLPRAPQARLALGLLAGLVAWNALSIAWADVPGAAWQDTNLLLVYALMAWLVVIVPWTAASASAGLGLFSAATAVICLLTLLRALGSDDLFGTYLTGFFDFRWSEPLGYPNAIAALAVIAAIGPLVLSTRSELGVGWTAAALAVATFLAGFALLPQSRGAVLGGIGAVAAALLLAPWRWRLVWRLAVVGLGLAFVAGPVFDVLAVAESGRDAGGALERATVRILIAAVLAAMAGVALTLGEQRVQIGEAGQRRSRRAGVVLLALLALGAGAIGVAKYDAISDAVSEQWQALKNPGAEFTGTTLEVETDSRLFDADPLQRYDYFRVALDAFRAAPLGGLGAGGFDSEYTRERRYEKYSAYPHNLPLRFLAENGIVGAGLALALLIVLAAGLLRGIRADRTDLRALAAAAAGMWAYFLIHAQFDWVEAFPVIAVPVLALLLVVVEVRHRRRHVAADPERRQRTLTSVVALGLAGVAAVSLAAPWLASRYRERSRDVIATDVSAAYANLDRAAKLDPLSEVALLQQGTIALRRGDLDRAEVALRRSLERRDGWLARFQLAIVLASQGERRAAMRQLRQAGVLNPLEPAISAAGKEIASGKPLDLVRLNQRLFDSPLFNAGAVP